jgi:branched-chain amino acid transport system substrate-binding protein
MKGRKIMGFVGMAVMLFLLTMVPCKGLAQKDAGPIKIGMSVPLSGHSADPGEQISRGARLAVDLANKAGGINGRKIELDIQDDAANPTTGVALLDKFAQEGVAGAIGYFNSAVGLAAQKLAEAKQIPLMVQGINSAINNPWTYHSVATDSEQARGAMLFLKERGHKKFAIMTDTSAFGTAALEQLKIALKNAKLEPVSAQTFEVEASDLTPQLLRIKNAGADAIILFTVGPPMARVMQGLAQIKYKIPVVGNFTAADAAVARIGGAAVDGLYYQDMVDPGKDAVKQLNAQWKKEYPGKGDIGVYTVVAYDQATILLEGIKSGATTGVQMKKFLDQYSSKKLASGIPGAAWKYTETDRGGLKAEDLVWVVYKQGVRSPVDAKNR